MLEMAHIDCIRTLRQWEGKGIAEIGRIMRVDWRTAKKYADAEGLPVSKARKRHNPKSDPNPGAIRPYSLLTTENRLP